MKILLLEDYSGLSKNLKEGLIALGHEVSLATTGDGYKQTSVSDLIIPYSNNRVVRVLKKIVFPFYGIKSYYHYDVVQLINHNIFGGLKCNYNYYVISKIRKHCDKLILSTCGTDSYVYKTALNARYSPYEEAIKYDKKGFNLYIKKEYVNNNDKILKMVDGIIPSLYSYAEPYRYNSKLIKTIPFPMNVDKIKYIPQKIVNNKLKIFHGVNREGFKGTRFIKEAMIKLKENYPNDVEIIIDGKMPLDRYLKVLEESNIIIDQALTYEYGMNAVYSMAMGKVVLSGNEPECQLEFGRNDIPIINILPNVDDIYQKLEKLVLDKNSVCEIGYNSRKFVEEFHHYIKVAQQYVDAWNSCKRINI